MNRIYSFFQRFVGSILFLSLVVTLIAGFYTAKLYSNLRTDLEELLPTTSQSVLDLNEVARRLKSIDNLALIISSKDVKASRRFVLDLVPKLQKLPPSEVALIEYRIDQELEFFRRRQALFLDLNELRDILSYIRKRIHYETELYNPLTIFSEEALPEPEMDFRSIQNKVTKNSASYAHYPDGFFATVDETKRAILIDVVGKSMSVDQVKALRSKVERMVEEVGPARYAPDLRVNYTGSVEEMLEEQDALVEDLVLSTVAVTLLISVAMFAYFQAFFPTLALMASLVCGTLWTFGFSYFAVGYLNANSAFLGSIVLGNGINFGIIFLARYLEERRAGHSHLRSNRTAVLTTWKATLTAALAAGLSYGSLALTSFRGFSQFGVIGLAGMILCWLGSYVLLPSLLSWFDRLGLMPDFKKSKRRGTFFTSAVAKSVGRFPKGIAVASILLTGVSLLSYRNVSPRLLETNLSNLRSKRSIESGAAFYSQDLNQIFKRFLTPLVILPASNENALEIAHRLKRLKEKQGPSSPIVSVQTIQDFVPPAQNEKIKILRQIKAELPPQLVARLGEEDRKKVAALLSPEALMPFTMEELPYLVREKFKEKNGSMGKLVLVEPPLSNDIWEGDHLNQFISSLRDVANEVEAGAPVAGGMAITADLIASISRDGPKATLVAFAAAVLLVIVLFMDLKRAFLALFALLIGIAWFGALIISLEPYGLKINFLNFVALPITFGIGIDYGINIFQRYNQKRAGDILQIVRETGGAVALCSLTTIIGYSSLLMASNKGFISFGLLAVLGELTCIVAALIALPAVLLTLKKL